MYRLRLGLLFLLLCLPCRAAEKVRRITVGGKERTFIVHDPANAGDADAKTPLVIALHGGASNARAMERFCGLDETADRHGFIVAYPNGTGRFGSIRTWNSGKFECYAKSKHADDVVFIRQLIDFMVSTYHVDPRRVYVTGISNGGMMAYRIAAEMPERIAAIAAIAGTLDVDPSAIRGPVPILHFHGTEDDRVPFNGGHGPRTFKDNTHLSVRDTMAAWVHVDGADATMNEDLLPNTNDDGTRVVRYVYGSADDPENVVLYKIIGGGHTWPGQARLDKLLGRATLDISADEIMWEFFTKHPLKERPSKASPLESPGARRSPRYASGHLG